MIKIKNLLLLVLLSVLLAACGSEKQYNALPANATVLILGDSLSYGSGAAKGQDFPSLLAANTGWNIINAGVPGDTSAAGLERLPDLLDEHQIDLL
ncbi:MAG: arylesterase, partial [Nitrosomonadales bacterium]|nr:arylesterase [Nitrosomonadales bacterium]